MFQPAYQTVLTAGWSIEKGKRRSTNEDSAAAINFDLMSGDDVQSVGIYAVADGMGGHEHGEVASRAAINSAIRGLVEEITEAEEEITKVYLQGLERAVQMANQAVYEQNSTDDSNMGTTLVMAVVVGNRAYIANVGDSRAYLITNDEITQITEDHSFVKQLVDKGIMTPELANKHPFRNVLSQGIGLKKRLEVDTFKREVEGDGYLLLCSDGLTNELSDDRIHDIVLSAADPQAACDALVDAANRAGGRDNISVVLIHFHRVRQREYAR